MSKCLSTLHFPTRMHGVHADSALSLHGVYADFMKTLCGLHEMHRLHEDCFLGLLWTCEESF